MSVGVTRVKDATPASIVLEGLSDEVTFAEPRRSWPWGQQV